MVRKENGEIRKTERKMWLGEEQEGKDEMGKERKVNSVKSKCFLHDDLRKGNTRNVNNDERKEEDIYGLTWK